MRAVRTSVDENEWQRLCYLHCREFEALRRKRVGQAGVVVRWTPLSRLPPWLFTLYKVTLFIRFASAVASASQAVAACTAALYCIARILSVKIDNNII